MGASSHRQQRSCSLSEGNAAPGVFGLSERDVQNSIMNVLPSQPERLLGPEPAIQENSRHVPKQERIVRLGGDLTSKLSPDAHPELARVLPRCARPQRRSPSNIETPRPP